MLCTAPCAISKEPRTGTAVRREPNEDAGLNSSEEAFDLMSMLV